jgi:hypothetical protein
MIDAQKPDHISLNTLLGRLQEGRFVIPDFQRDFEWEPWDITALMRSVFLDYYIGSLLLWKGKEENFSALSCEPIYGFSEKGSPEHIVLDGQQRLTAIYYAFCAPNLKLPNRANPFFYFIRVDRMMEEDYDEAFYYKPASNGVLQLLEDTNTQFETHTFPIKVASDSWRLADWARGYEEYWKKRAEQDPSEHSKPAQHAASAKKFAQLLKALIDKYQISYIELDRELAIDKICDIFTQINSKGVRLDVFDLLNALLKPKGVQLKQMWRKALPTLGFVQSDKLNVYVLQVMSILRQSYCSPKYLYYLVPGQVKLVRQADGTNQKEILIETADEFAKLWEQAVAGLNDSVKTLKQPQEYGAIKPEYLPYPSMLPVFTALREYAASVPTASRLSAQHKIKQWYWASAFTSRYSSSAESTSARDFMEVKSWIDSDENKPTLIAEFANHFATLDLRTQTKRGTSIYNAIFNLLIIEGARDWVTGAAPQNDDLDDHHIIPSSWGQENLQGDLYNTILNRTPISSETNRHIINDRLPNEYLPEMIAQSGEQKVRAVLESHFISRTAFDVLLRTPFTPADFDEFIAERQRSIRNSIEGLLIKERIDLTPVLRDLDARVEAVELRIRTPIVTVLTDDPKQLPPHLQKAIDERIEKAAKKNPAMDLGDYKSLNSKMEFFDLRDLQQTIVSGQVWPKFQQRFVNQVPLNQKFDQLAELRNGIRHSRTVTEIVRKEGEAAILWFDEVLKKASAQTAS